MHIPHTSAYTNKTCIQHKHEKEKLKMSYLCLHVVEGINMEDRNKKLQVGAGEMARD